MNWQHCSQMAFVGLDHSFEMYYQAIRRCWRFGQVKPVTVHVFLGQSEGQIIQSLKRKEESHNQMSIQMVDHMKEFMEQEIFETKQEKSGYKTDLAQGSEWRMYLGDCIDIMKKFKPDSIDYTIFSPPFDSLYTYSNSDRDMGCLLYTSPSPRDGLLSRMPSSA